jgi:peptide deformylase
MIKLLMQLEILQIGDERLLTPSKKIENFTDKGLQKLIDDMIDTCEQGKKYTAGLAAPQVGKNIQLTIVRRIDLEGDVRKKRKKGEYEQTREESLKLWEPLLNPRIIIKDREEESLVWEACLSIGKGKKQLYGPVFRPSWVEMEYQDRNGETKKIRGEGFFSHVLQHELDHLKGILFTSRVADPDKNLWLSKDLDDYLKEYDKFPEVM